MILKSFLSSFILRLVGFQDNVPKAKQEELNIKYQTCYEENRKKWPELRNIYIHMYIYRSYRNGCEISPQQKYGFQ